MTVQTETTTLGGSALVRRSCRVMGRAARASNAVGTVRFVRPTIEVRRAERDVQVVSVESESGCRALVADGQAPPNPLFTPPCDCPRCTPDRIYVPGGDDGWLRKSGDDKRYRVEVIALGATGKAVLG